MKIIFLILSALHASKCFLSLHGFFSRSLPLMILEVRGVMQTTSRILYYVNRVSCNDSW